MNERQREPGNAILPAECSLMEETAAFEALFPCGRTVRDSFDGLRIALCTEGAMRIEVDGIGHELERGQLLCLTPSRRIRVESHTAELRLRMLSFSFDFLAGQPFLLRASVSEAMEQNPCIAPDRQAWRSLSELFDFLRMQLARDGFPSRREVVEALLFVLVAETSHLYADRPLRRRGARCEQIADGFFALLHRNFASSTARSSTPPSSASPRSTSSAPSHAPRSTRPDTGLRTSGCARPTCCCARPT